LIIQYHLDFFSLKMYNLCKSISIRTYTFTFDFYIHGPALIVEFLFKNTNPIQRISIEFNTSSFLLSYVDRLIGIEDAKKLKWKKFLSADIFFPLSPMENISITFVAKSVGYRQRIPVRYALMILIRRSSYEYPSEISLLKKENTRSYNVTVANQCCRTSLFRKN
jgi:hypothetical protein